jgi:hypothetical protein
MDEQQVRGFDPFPNIFLAQEANKKQSYILFALLVDDKGYRLAIPTPTREWLRAEPGELKACEAMVIETLKDVVDTPLDDLELKYGERPKV